MRQRATVVLGLMLAACGLDLDSVPRISVEELRALMDQGQAVAVDVRTEDTYRAGHIAGALHVPAAEIGASLAELPRDRRVVTYCS